MPGTERSGVAVKREANELMRTALLSDGELPFFCECDDPSCLRTVWLCGRDYDRARRDPEWRPIAAEHRYARVAEAVDSAARH